MFPKQPFKYSPPTQNYPADAFPNRFSEPSKIRTNSFGPNQQPMFLSPTKNAINELGLKSYRSETRPRIFENKNDNARYDMEYINGKIMNEITEIMERKKSIKSNQTNHLVQNPNNTPNRNYFSNSPNEPVYVKQNTAPPDISQFYSNPYNLAHPQSLQYEYYAQPQPQTRLSEQNSPKFVNGNNNMERNFHKVSNPHHNDHQAKRASSQGIDKHISDSPQIAPNKFLDDFIKEKKLTPNAMTYSFRTKKGYQQMNPNKINQDSFIAHPNFNQNPYQHLFAVFDGHGINGHLVSLFIKQELQKTLASSTDLSATPVNALKRSIFETQKALEESSSIIIDLSGSTLTSLFIQKNKLYICNIGDSRTVLAKKNADHFGPWIAVPLSEDHKPESPAENERINNMGGRVDQYKDIKGEKGGPYRVWVRHGEYPGLAMSRSMGDQIAKSVGVICDPEIREIDIAKEDKFIILASDGLWEFLTNEECVNIIGSYYLRNDIEGGCEALMSEASHRWKKNSNENERRQAGGQRPQNNEEFKSPPNPPKGENKNQKIENPFDILKNQGNEYFKKGNYEKAIECYTKAIEKDSSQAVYYMNRAIAYKYSNNLKKALRDSTIALELDDRNYKTYLLLGRILAENAKTVSSLENIRKAIAKIEKSIKVYYENNQVRDPIILTEIRTFYLRAKKLLFYKLKEISKSEQYYLLHLCKGSEFHEEVQKIIAEAEKKEKENYVIPDEFCCKITLDLMEQPYLCSSGVSYEKKVLFEHLEKNQFDPVTREYLLWNQVYPNVTLKNAIDNFIENNPWAFEYNPDENYMNILF